MPVVVYLSREEDEYEESDQAQSSHSIDGESIRGVLCTYCNRFFSVIFLFVFAFSIYNE